MKKKILTFGLLGLGLSALISLGFIKAKPAMMASADGEDIQEVEPTPEPEPEVFESKIVIDLVEHGSLKFSATEGHAGDIIIVTATPDWFYKIDAISVNGTALIESESVSGEYSFALVEGENKIKATFVVNQELLGAFASIYDQAMNKDWTSLFSVANIITLVKWVVDSGVLIMVIRYFIRDKKLAAKVEKTVKKSIETIVPEMTKETVNLTIKDVIQPIFAQTQAQMTEVMQGMNVFSKVLALMQENTPEARIAILDALSTLTLADLSSVAKVQEYIKELVTKQQETYNEVMERLDKIQESKKEQIVEEELVNDPAEEEIPVEHTESVDNGTQI